MRKFMLSALLAVFAISAAFAQSGEDALKNATKSYSKYSSSSDVMELQTAVDAIEVALDDSQMQSNYEAYLEAGNIYAAAINEYVTQRSISPGETVNPMVARAASKAAQAYMKAYELADKRRGQKDALEGLQNLQANISNEGIYAIQDENYGDSFEAFNTSVTVHEFLSDNDGDSAFEGDEAKLNEERYYAALSAVLAENFDAAEPLFIALYEENYDDASIYDGLFKVYSGKGDMESAGKYLSEGREKYPENTQLLFSEINYYLAEGRLDELTDKLQEAINAEPENVSLYATLGQVYEQLYNKQRETDPEAATEYFEKAKSNYERGLEVEPENASLIYSLGALYFNRAAKMTEQLVDLSSDLSKDGQAKYEALEKEINNEFDQAFPYFQKAEMTDPNNRNTLIALKEIFARRDNFEGSTEMKNRLDRIEAGETIESSYFE
ncbi:hypothetical protein CLV84_3632 [Neolewinella xylanilytica]|uniref:Tetratricopeptide repeat protein n=2 Tax=Neolewinella xylanilytica TaxID=1514080 RepID=A0A2S6I6A2_9BACT|nr:hypothetical protein CLV84_3632 [Neolewinella xylanilytica]